MKTIKFEDWTLRDLGANTLTGGGLTFGDTRLTKIDGNTVFEMFNRKNAGHRVKFVDILEDVAAGNKYRISIRVRLGASCTADSAQITVGVTDPFALHPAFFCPPQKVTKNEWVTIEFTHTVTDDSHSSVSVEQPGNAIPLAENILIADITAELLHKVPKKQDTDGRKTLWLIGDSITCQYPENSVTRGWGMYVGEWLDERRIKVCNMARAGFSTQSYINTDGLSVWNFVCKKMRKGDLLIVSLGINDFSSSLPERKTTAEQYAENLRAFADKAKELGVGLLFATSTVTVEKDPAENFRRGFPEIMIGVANEKRALGYDVNCIDLNAHMLEEIRKIEANEGHEYLVNTFFSQRTVDGGCVPDTTHQCEAGARWVASMIVELLRKSDFSLKEFLR